jgi:hypothetical protein
MAKETKTPGKSAQSGREEKNTEKRAKSSHHKAVRDRLPSFRVYGTKEEKRRHACSAIFVKEECKIRALEES